jgi:hypothetical protein
MITSVSAGLVYEHDEYGEVLVDAIHDVYGSYDVTDSDGVNNYSSETVVVFHSEFDEYGGMLTPLREEVNSFVSSVEPVRVWNEEMVTDCDIDEAFERLDERSDARDYMDIDPEEYSRELDELGGE